MIPRDIQEWVLIAFSATMGAVIGFIYSVVSVFLWIFKSIFIGLIKLSLLLIEWADDRWYQQEIADRH